MPRIDGLKPNTYLRSIVLLIAPSYKLRKFKQALSDDDGKSFWLLREQNNAGTRLCLSSEMDDYICSIITHP